MASTYEKTLNDCFTRNGVRFLWQDESDDIPAIKFQHYGRNLTAKPDFYLPDTQLYVEVKGHMTFDKVSRMLVLASLPGIRYYVYQQSEEDWDPTIGAIVPTDPAPDSMKTQPRKDFNRELQQRELVRLATDDVAAATVSAITTKRLRAYVAFFDAELRQTLRSGLLGS